VKTRLLRILLAVFVISLTVGADIPAEANNEMPWSTFLGGSGYDNVHGIAVDSIGNVYITGDSGATWGNPVSPYVRNSDCFVAKLNSSGVLQWNTFLGGSDYDCGYGIAVDSSGNIYVAGYSGDTWGNPVRTYTGNYDAFAAKLDSNGALKWNTFLGGSEYDLGNGLAVDASGNLYVIGQSDAAWGNPVRAYTVNTDAFAAKVDSSGALLWNTFLGGSSLDCGYGIAMDSGGNIYVDGYSGNTWGSPVSAFTGSVDAFAAKLDSNGVLQWNTFLGGTSSDYGYSIAVDSFGNVYVTGLSNATWGSPARAYTDTGHTDAFAAKLDSSGVLQWTTFLGGNSSDCGYGVAADSSSNVYVTGFSNATWGSPIRAVTGGGDAFAAKLDNSGALLWNTFLGGTSSDYGYAIAVDSGGNIYVAGYSSATWGNPIREYTGNGDAFVAKLESNGSLEAPVIPPVPELPAGILLGIGIVGTGAFILIRRKKATNSM